MSPPVWMNVPLPRDPTWKLPPSFMNIEPPDITTRATLPVWLPIVAWLLNVSLPPRCVTLTGPLPAQAMLPSPITEELFAVSEPESISSEPLCM